MIYKYLKYSSALFVSALLFTAGCEKQEWPSNPPDVVRPELVSVEPSDGSLMNPTSSTIKLMFNKQMDVSALSSLVKFTDSHENIINGTWSVNGNEASFKPGSDLTELTRYDIMIPGGFDESDNWKSPGVRDMKGNSLKYDYSFSFSTQGDYGGSQIYLGTGDPGNPSGAQPGIGIIKDLEFSTVGDLGTDGAKGIALNPSGSELFIANSGQNSVDILNTSANSIDVSIALPDGYGQPWVVGFTPDGLEAWVLCRENNGIAVINTQTRTVSDTIPLADYCEGGGTLYQIAINNAGTKGYVSTRGSLSLIIIDIQNKSVITSIENIVDSQASAVVVTPDDSKILVGNNWSTPHFQIVDAASNTVSGDLTLGEASGSGLLTTTFGDYLYLCGRYEGFVYKIDMKDFSIVAETNTDQEMMGIAVDPAGTVIYITAPYVGDGSVLVLAESDLSILGNIATGAWRGIVTR